MATVSVVIPAYKHADFIMETLESVTRQSFRDYEIIVVNDGSPDRTGEVVRAFGQRHPVRYFEQANAGQAAARNHGLREACGQYVAFLDDDDCWPENKLQWQVDYLRQHPDVCLVAGGWRDSWEEALRDQAQELGAAQTFSCEAIIGGNPIISPGQTLIRRQALFDINGFRQDIWGCDDWEIYLRLSRVSPIAVFSRASLYYRDHPANASKDMVRLLRNALVVLQIHLAPLEPAAQAKWCVEARRWMYLFGVHGGLSSLKQSLRRRDFGGSLSILKDLYRRLRVIKLDKTILQCLFQDCVRAFSK